MPILSQLMTTSLQKHMVQLNLLIKWEDSKGKKVYLHFVEDCLKSYVKDFNYNMMNVLADTDQLLPKQEKDYLKLLGIKFT